MSSKIIGTESSFFSELAVSAANIVKTENKEGKVKCNINNIHILKSHGLSSLDSELVPGFALNCARASQQMPSKLVNCKIALLDFNLQKQKLQMGVQIVVKDTKQVTVYVYIHVHMQYCYLLLYRKSIVYAVTFLCGYYRIT